MEVATVEFEHKKEVQYAELWTEANKGFLEEIVTVRKRDRKDEEKREEKREEFTWEGSTQQVTSGKVTVEKAKVVESKQVFEEVKNEVSESDEEDNAVDKQSEGKEFNDVSEDRDMQMSANDQPQDSVPDNDEGNDFH